MTLHEWRIKTGATLADAAQRIGITGTGPARAFQRLERGEHKIDAPMAAQIVERTGGAVTLEDMHNTRLAFLQSQDLDRAA